MSFADWLRGTQARISDDGFEGAIESAYELYLGFLRKVNQLTAPGTPIYEREWDVLIVLDACRTDVISEVASQYQFVKEISTYRSPGSCSPEWMDKTFTETYESKISNTVYITGNPFSERRLELDQFEHVDEAWKHSWDEETGTIPPQAITDRAIVTARNQEPDHLILHYMQPHFPSIPDQITSGISLESFDETWVSPLDKLQEGEITRQRAWESYRANLEHVLDNLETVLNNMDAETVVITADHGEAFGEYGVYEHPHGMPLSCLRDVPWVETSANDTGEYEPEIDVEEDSDQSVEEKLTALGYM